MELLILCFNRSSGLDRRDNICKPLSEENAKAEAWLQEKQQQKPLVKYEPPVLLLADVKGKTSFAS